MSDRVDIGDLARVPPSQRRDVDGGDGSDASTDGADDDLQDVYDDPGEVVEL